MRRLTHFFRNLSVTLKLVLVVFFVALIYFAKEATYMYLTLRSNVESLVGTRMEFVARTAALVVNGDSHQKIVRAYMDRDPRLTKRRDFKKIQRILRRIQKVNELGSDIYTLVQPQWKENSLVYITMSNRKTYVGNSVPVNPKALESLRRGRATHTEFYRDARGTWVSAYAPIRNSKKSVVALVAVDYRVDEELKAARTKVIEWAGLPSAILLFFFLILAAIAGRSISGPLRELTDTLSDSSDGNPASYLSTDRNDEIGALAKAVNSFVELNTHNTLETRSQLSSLKSEHETVSSKLSTKELELKRTVQAYQALLGKLNQGCFIFIRDGKVLHQYSKVCEEYFEAAPDKAPIWKTLQMDEAIGKGVLEEIFSEVRPIHELLEKLPSQIKNSTGKRIFLEYHPLRNANKEITGIVVIATTHVQKDVAPPPPLPTPKNELKFTDKILRYKHQVAHYIRNTRAGLHLVRGAQHNESVMKSELAQEILDEIKSGAMLFSITEVRERALLAEEAFKALKSNPGHTKFVDDFEDQIKGLEEAIQNFVDESESLLGLELHSDDHTIQVSHRELVDFSREIANASSPEEIKESFDAHFVREPIQKFVGHFDELIQQVGEKHGKKVLPLQISGGETCIVPEPYLELLAALLHPLRNAVEFGIETPMERLAKSKNEAGQLSIHFSLTQGQDDSPSWLFITVEDDGVGVDPAVVRDRLRQAGDAEADSQSDYEILQRILSKNFTTSRNDASKATRGEGLYLLNQIAKNLGGSVEIVAVPKKGTQISIMVPYKEDLKPRSGSPSILQAA